MTKSGFDLDEIERLLAAATPGEWNIIAATFSDENGDVRYEVEGEGVKHILKADAALIVAARNSLPAMLTAIRELRAENARLAGLSKHNNELARMRHAQANDFRAKYVSVTGDPS